MSDNTERLIVDVDASGVNAGAKSLADLVDAAQDAGRAADGLGDKFDHLAAGRFGSNVNDPMLTFAGKIKAGA